MFQQLAYRASEVVWLKLTLLKGYTWFIGHMQRLSPGARQAEDVRLLASVLTYFIQGLIQGPPEMSSSRDMVKDFILARARTFGIASLPPHPLAEDLLRMSGEIIFSTYKILRPSKGSAGTLGKRYYRGHNITQTIQSARPRWPPSLCVHIRCCPPGGSSPSHLPRHTQAQHLPLGMEAIPHSSPPQTREAQLHRCQSLPSHRLTECRQWNPLVCRQTPQPWPTPTTGSRTTTLEGTQAEPPQTPYTCLPKRSKMPRNGARENRWPLLSSWT
jgi:hypothetical protein